MAYAVGHVSGGHFNPAVTVGLAAARRFAWKDVPGYVVAQVVGAITRGGGAVGDRQRRATASAPRRAASPPTGTATARPAATRCWRCWWPRSSSRRSSSTSSSAPPTPARPRGSRRWRIGLSLTLIHLVSIPVSNTSVNPARSIGPALFAGWRRDRPAVGLHPGAARRCADRRRVVRRALRHRRGSGAAGGRDRRVTVGQPPRSRRSSQTRSNPSSAHGRSRPTPLGRRRGRTRHPPAPAAPR